MCCIALNQSYINVFEAGGKKWNSDFKESREVGEEAKDESQGVTMSPLLVLDMKRR